MRQEIAIASIGCVLLAGTAVHLRAIAQNQVNPISQNAPVANPHTANSHIAAPKSRITLQRSDQQEFDYILKQAKVGKLPQSSFGELVQAIAAEFRGYPYEADLLDQREPEILHLSLKKFDCVLFVEAMLGLARTISAQDDKSATTFIHSMETQRYRQGKLGDYCSRLHYFSEWILENQRQGLVRDLGEELGGIPLDKSLNFMSQNWQKYPRMLNHQRNRDCIQSMEQQLGQVQLRYVPTSKIHQAYDRLQSGDIIAIATQQAGLDVTHTGLVYKRADGVVGLIHAAPRVGVIVSPDLQGYVEQLGRDSIGILVARPTQ